MTKIVCDCKRLVEVVGRVVSLHYRPGDEVECPKSGTRYVPQRSTRFQEALDSAPPPDPMGPPVQVLSKFSAPCLKNPGHDHEHAVIAIRGDVMDALAPDSGDKSKTIN